MQALGLERYHLLFVEQEIDLTCVHAVSAEELASIGVVDRLHQVGSGRPGWGWKASRRVPSCASKACMRAQRPAGAPPNAKVQAQGLACIPTVLHLSGLMQARIVQAAEALASQLGLRQLRGTGGGGSARQQPPGAKRQKQLSLLPADRGAAAAGTTAVPAGAHAGLAAAAASAGQVVQEAWQQRQPPAGDNPHRDAGPRPEERALLASLYPPPQPAAAHKPPAAAQGTPPQRLTPQLAGGRSLARGAPAGAASLWAGAAACREVAPTLGARLAQREAADPEGAATRRQPLARGGTAYPAGEESRALKRVRLDALRQELRTHEETVVSLRAMIAQLEREVGDGAAAVG